MKFKLELETTSDSYGCQDMEVAAILRALAEKIDGHPNFSPGWSNCITGFNSKETGNAWLEKTT